MGELLVIVIGRMIIQPIGLFTRYFFFKLIGKKKSLESLSEEHTDDYADLDKGMAQQFWNGAVGFTALLVVMVLIVELIGG